MDLAKRNELIRLKIKGYLRANNIPYAEFGESVGVSRQNVYAWVSGRAGISAAKLEVIRERYPFLNL